MRTILLLASAASVVLTAPALALSDGSNNGAAQSAPEKSGPARGGGENSSKAQRPANGQGGNPKAKRNDAQHAMEGNAAAHGNDKRKVENRSDRSPDRASPVAKVERAENDGRDGKRQEGSGIRDTRRDTKRDTSRLLVNRSWDGNRYRYDDRAYLVPTSSWCPPGLAKKGNGCTPPGQARKLDRFDGWSNWYPVRDRNDGYDWRQDGGYLYRIGNGGIVSALIPLIGGALSGGQVWPAQYTGYEAPAYYDRFYGRDDSYDYRIAQNAIFAVDPQSSQIEAIAGLLTGDRWSVGQRMPQGYDAYNVPLDYRDRYADRRDASYRYSDGYVYEVDPTTQLVRTVIELLV